MKHIILIFILVLFLSFQTLHAQNAYVKKVIFGNKIELDTGDIIEYIGVNIPLDSDIYNSAFELNKKLVEANKILLEYDEKKNSDNGCLLAYVYCGDVFVNAEIIKQGYGIVDIHSPNIKYAELLIKAEREAREQKQGFWAKRKEDLATGEYVSIEKRILKLEAGFYELNKKIDQLIELFNALILKMNSLSIKPEKSSQTNEKQDTNLLNSNANNSTVHVTKLGKKYHKLGCRFLGENPKAINIEEARQKGYQPCKICFPD